MKNLISLVILVVPVVGLNGTTNSTDETSATSKHLWIPQRPQNLYLGAPNEAQHTIKHISNEDKLQQNSSHGKFVIERPLYFRPVGKMSFSNYPENPSRRRIFRKVRPYPNFTGTGIGYYNPKTGQEKLRFIPSSGERVNRHQFGRDKVIILPSRLNMHKKTHSANKLKNQRRHMLNNGTVSMSSPDSEMSYDTGSNSQEDNLRISASTVTSQSPTYYGSESSSFRKHMRKKPEMVTPYEVEQIFEENIAVDVSDEVKKEEVEEEVTSMPNKIMDNLQGSLNKIVKNLLNPKVKVIPVPLMDQLNDNLQSTSENQPIHSKLENAYFNDNAAGIWGKDPTTSKTSLLDVHSTVGSILKNIMNPKIRPTVKTFNEQKPETDERGIRNSNRGNYRGFHKSPVYSLDVLNNGDTAPVDPFLLTSNENNHIPDLLQPVTLDEGIQEIMDMPTKAIDTEMDLLRPLSSASTGSWNEDLLSTASSSTDQAEYWKQGTAKITKEYGKVITDADRSVETYQKLQIEDSITSKERQPTFPSNNNHKLKIHKTSNGRKTVTNLPLTLHHLVKSKEEEVEENQEPSHSPHPADKQKGKYFQFLPKFPNDVKNLPQYNADTIKADNSEESENVGNVEVQTTSQDFTLQPDFFQKNPQSSNQRNKNVETSVPKDKNLVHQVSHWPKNSMNAVHKHNNSDMYQHPNGKMVHKHKNSSHPLYYGVNRYRPRPNEGSRQPAENPRMYVHSSENRTNNSSHFSPNKHRRPINMESFKNKTSQAVDQLKEDNHEEQELEYQSFTETNYTTHTPHNISNFTVVSIPAENPKILKSKYYDSHNKNKEMFNYMPSTPSRKLDFSNHLDGNNVSIITNSTMESITSNETEASHLLYTEKQGVLDDITEYTLPPTISDSRKNEKCENQTLTTQNFTGNPFEAFNKSYTYEMANTKVMSHLNQNTTGRKKNLSTQYPFNHKISTVKMSEMNQDIPNQGNEARVPGTSLDKSDFSDVSDYIDLFNAFITSGPLTTDYFTTPKSKESPTEPSYYQLLTDHDNMIPYYTTSKSKVLYATEKDDDLVTENINDFTVNPLTVDLLPHTRRLEEKSKDSKIGKGTGPEYYENMTNSIDEHSKPPGVRRSDILIGDEFNLPIGNDLNYVDKLLLNSEGPGAAAGLTPDKIIPVAPQIIKDLREGKIPDKSLKTLSEILGEKRWNKIVTLSKKTNIGMPKIMKIKSAEDFDKALNDLLKEAELTHEESTTKVPDNYLEINNPYDYMEDYKELYGDALGDDFYEEMTDKRVIKRQGNNKLSGGRNDDIFDFIYYDTTEDNVRLQPPTSDSLKQNNTLEHNNTVKNLTSRGR